MKKRKLAVALVTVMLLGTGDTAFANNVEARKPTCPNCNEGMYTDYRIFKASPCKICGASTGCYEYWWGWECGICGEFIKTFLKESLCSK